MGWFSFGGVEDKDEVIRQLKGKNEDETPEVTSKQFQQTNSGEFCMKAMKELELKFTEESERPEWYMKSLKNLIYESSSLTNPRVKNLIQAEKKLFKEEEEEEEELNEIDQVCEELDTKKEEVTKHCEDVITREPCVELEDTKDYEYEDDFEDMSEE